MQLCRTVPVWDGGSVGGAVGQEAGDEGGHDGVARGADALVDLFVRERGGVDDRGLVACATQGGGEVLALCDARCAAAACELEGREIRADVRAR